jgi:hypothetical protein
MAEKKIAGKWLGDILGNLFRSLWLFFPGVLFLLICLFAFINLTQGKDLIVLSSEKPGNYLFFLIALTCLVLVCWYGARLVADAKENKQPGYLTPFLNRHVPRFIGFTFFTLFILAFIQTPLFTPISKKEEWNIFFYWLFFAASFAWYWLWSLFIEKRFARIVFNLTFYMVTGIIILSSVLVAYQLKHFNWLIIINLLAIQWGFLVFVITKRKYIDYLHEDDSKMAKLPVFVKTLSRKIGVTPAEEVFHLLFIVLAFFVIAIYISCTLSISFAVYITSFPFVLLAFTVFAGGGYLITYCSVKWNFNVHMVLLLLVFIIGLWTERHQAGVIEKQKPVNFKARATLKKYFEKWVEERKNEIDSSSAYPVYFSLGDGGASRSGYWVASVLSRMQEESNGRFGKHLFCLSGASGGSVGNAAFFLLLKQRGNDASQSKFYLKDSKDYLKSDFLTYTLSRWFGYDFIVQLWPFNTAGDRSKALAEAMEKAPEGDTVFLEKEINMGIPFSQLMINNGDVKTNLPILCVNTTRMQDGLPSVFSTININANRKEFNGRLDVLSLLQDSTDIKLSTAVVLGASFPYVCPAGRIDKKVATDTNDPIRENYFVDGGYVDNSGAGVVHEMLIQLQRTMADTAGLDAATKARYQKLKMQVIHITNGSTGEAMVKKVNPFINDLAAPLKTLAGSYGIQTTVNDSRLENYMKSIGKNNYWNINLYRNDTSEHFSMNWVISQNTLSRVDNRLEQNCRDQKQPLYTLLKQVKELKN